MSNQHYLKTLPEYFNAVENGTKPFEVRKNDRNYQVGDTLHLQEYSNGAYTGREISKKICYILDNPTFCKDGFVVLGLQSTCNQLEKSEMHEQIEEMAKTIAIKRGVRCDQRKSNCERCSSLGGACLCYDYAKILYDAGYRKQIEGEWVYHECVSSCDGVKSGYSCSVCDAFVDENSFEAEEFHKAFCGACGAKMKGGAECK